MKWLKGLLINFQFFTSIPVPVELPMDKDHLEKAIKTFPLLGLIQGGIYASLFYAILHWTPFSVLTAALVLWLAGIIITGGIHLDGWMDTSDAFFSYRDREKRLEIMKDPRTGAFGVLSVIVLLTAKFFFMYEITQKALPATYLFIAAIPFFSKMVMGVLLLKVKAAKKEGLGTLFKNASNKRTLVIYPIYVILLLAAAGILFNHLLFGMIVFTVVSILFLLILSRKIISWFGGMTGDVLGASVEGMELVLWMILWLLHYFAMG
ncbi:adenosylcobinamide-GDP ribazoletransferase [Cytobacillus solani]|uniref:Adenosylcobinamide-GDP ribazoletransferase n=1 Tax=Cytobacillus solani TaxID=1637975 RepID=A0A0Q3U3H1_9BACI|nr:adenosylcobinamide-GDP ribazoletransferase [Cytobacillus solani]KOP79604.1 cobalamin biosynthesis protein CobS [Bacillus sp. FJAT-21945]KQL17602.1 cobalamin biosynthesis protein CobS [Cytobacillus solani]USK55465.1 adenosylcobinamide-GDP ribazoletransferase [Cytobacillus solani]